MKKNYALAFGLLLATGLIAQTNSSSPVAAPVPAAVAKPASAVAAPVAATNILSTPAAAKKPAARKAAPKRPAIVEKPVALMPGPAVVDARNVNVRGRSTIMSEVLARLTKGDAVTVIEQVTNQWAKGDDMKQWARIAYPSNATAWVFASFVDSNKTVIPKRLNLRGGPGENYSIVGRMTKGTKVTEIVTKGEWMQVAPTEGTTAFIAAMYLKQDAAMLAAAEPVKPAPPIEPASTNVITEVAAIATETTDMAAAPGTNELAAFAAEMAGDTNAMPTEPEEPLPPRVVMREGVVRGSTSIQAPSYFSLAGMDTGRTINYLYTPSTNVDLTRYVGLHIIATGEESLDERWPNTPVLTLQRIQVVDE
jgi:uncharacterized protein YgiM (DUF1202 family)